MRLTNLFLLAVPLFFGAANVANASEEQELKDYQQTGLPVCFVDFDPSQTISKEQKIPAKLTLVEGKDTLCADISIWGRGNSTWSRDKKPYNIKFEKKASPLGMKEGKKFALLANDYDPSKMRTAIGFAVGEWVGSEWALHGHYVELVLNGAHKGNYYLCERISQSVLDLDKKLGLILEYKYADQLDEDAVHFVTATKGYLMEFKDPDDPVECGDVYNSAMRRMNELEEALYASDWQTARLWESKVDIDNFVRWYYAKNLLQLDECNRYYVIENYKDDSPIKMAPLWDFDWCMGWQMGERHNNDYYMRNNLYFEQISHDTEFLKKVAALHLLLRSKLKENINNMYDSLSVKLRKSVELDNKIWWHAYAIDWDKELQTDREYLLATIHFLDAQLKPYMGASGIDAVNADPMPNCKLLHGGKLYILKGCDVYDSMGNRLAPRSLDFLR